MINTQRFDLAPTQAGGPAPWLECRISGPDDAPVLLFLHGFPEAAFAWDPLLEHFGRCWRCIAPNLRGYPGSYAPSEIEAYRAQHVIADLCGLVAQLQHPVAAVIGHDWGGAIAWGMAIAYPELMQRLIILNSPHPALFLSALQSDPEQQAASSYMNLLRGATAEQVLAANDFAQMWTFFTRFGDASWLTPALEDKYRAAWRCGLSGPLNYYRASPLYPPLPGDDAVLRVQLPAERLKVHVPTHVIWGEGDTALLPCLLDGLEAFVPDLRVSKIPGATHWLIHEIPDQVGALIASSLAR